MLHDKAKKIQLMFAISGITILTILLIATIYAFNFLSAKVIQSFSVEGGPATQVQFNIGEFNRLNIR